ncbi:MAG: serine/threonine-protein kinase [Myxococcota bacterium]
MERRIGQGAWGEVFLALDAQLDRRVALKLLREDLADGARQARDRMLREARAMARLAHPNVVGVHDAGEHEQRVFIAMEFVEGETLKAWLARERRTWVAIVEAFLQAGRGLAAAHAAGIVHRDFKPANVLMDGGGVARVTDFGLARYGDAPAEEYRASPSPPPGPGESLTQTGDLVGTPGYMAPEQLTGSPADARSDQFSFCVALFEALYGFKPWEGASLAEFARAASSGKVRPPPPRTDVPPGLHRVLARGLAAKPAERFSSMEEVLGELAVASISPNYARISAIFGLWASAVALALTVVSEMNVGNPVPGIAFGVGAMAVGGTVVPIAAAGGASARGRLGVPGNPRMRLLGWLFYSAALVGGLGLVAVGSHWTPPRGLVALNGIIGTIGGVLMASEALLASRQARALLTGKRPPGPAPS